EKLRGEAAQRENRRKIAQSVTVWYWNKDGEQPTRKAIQGITTFPTFNLAQLPAVLEELDIASGERIELYQLKLRFWQTQDVDEAFIVSSQQHLLIRRLGVTNCVDIDSRIAEALGDPAPALTPLHPSHTPSPLPIYTSPAFRTPLLSPHTASSLLGHKRAREDDMAQGSRHVQRQSMAHQSPRGASSSASLWSVRLPSPATPMSPGMTPPSSPGSSSALSTADTTITSIHPTSYSGLGLIGLDNALLPPLDNMQPLRSIDNVLHLHRQSSFATSSSQAAPTLIHTTHSGSVELCMSLLMLQVSDGLR
ncbi:hypothetical protein K466DRAFT_607812, partial [Polyporus arcularius HHB13444]